MFKKQPGKFREKKKTLLFHCSVSNRKFELPENIIQFTEMQWF